MRIEEELKLDYSDVLFRPKRSTLSSRKDVDLNRTYKFKYSKNEWSGIPIMAANMDGVGELGIADELSTNEMITCLTKQHDVKKLSKYKQVICITHLPQIATSADNHLHITKSVINSNSTSVKAEYLTGDFSRNVIKNLFMGEEVET